MDHYYDKSVLERTLSAKFVKKRVATRGQVIVQLKQFVDVNQLEAQFVDVNQLEAIYKTGKGAEWYITLTTPRETELMYRGGIWTKRELCILTV